MLFDSIIKVKSHMETFDNGIIFEILSRTHGIAISLCKDSFKTIPLRIFVKWNL